MFLGPAQLPAPVRMMPARPTANGVGAAAGTRTCNKPSSCEATKTANVMRCCLHRRARYSVSRCPPGAATTREPPHANAPKSSCAPA